MQITERDYQKKTSEVPSFAPTGVLHPQLFTLHPSTCFIKFPFHIRYKIFAMCRPLIFAMCSPRHPPKLFTLDPSPFNPQP